LRPEVKVGEDTRSAGVVSMDWEWQMEMERNW